MSSILLKSLIQSFKGRNNVPIQIQEKVTSLMLFLNHLNIFQIFEFDLHAISALEEHVNAI